MSVMLATLALNEIQWLDFLYRQHRNFPSMGKWVFVESADRVYAETNPEMVTDKGLSVDGTSEFLADLAKKDERVVYIPLGFSKHDDPAQGKVASRNAYLEVADRVKPKFLFILDGDEFLTHKHQEQVVRMMGAAPRHCNAFMFGLRSIWRPPSIAHEPLFKYEAVGCLWSVPICRGWRWIEGMRYTSNHNTPSTPDGTLLLTRTTTSNFTKWANVPETIHLGFTSSLKTRESKHRYYTARGEGVNDNRGRYVECRRFFETYQPGDEPPHGAKIVGYTGPVPEIFQEVKV